MMIRTGETWRASKGQKSLRRMEEIHAQSKLLHKTIYHNSNSKQGWREGLRAPGVYKADGIRNLTF
jgi:hypothetical protein